MKRLVFVLLASAVVLLGCESDAQKLNRLRTSEAATCRPVMVLDSAARHDDAVSARVEARNRYGIQPADLPAARADLDTLKRIAAADSNT